MEPSGNIELKAAFAVRTKSTQTWKRGALSAANALQDIVQNTVELIGCRRSADVRFPRQPLRELFLLHVNLRIRWRSTQPLGPLAATCYKLLNSNEMFTQIMILTRRDCGLAGEAFLTTASGLVHLGLA